MKYQEVAKIVTEAPGDEAAPELEFVDPVYLHEAWPLVRGALDRHCAEHRPEWIPEDVYLELKLGRNQLFLGRGGADGFMIVTTMQDTRGGLFWIWYAEGRGQGASYFPQILDMARVAGCNRIAFATPLPFWDTHCEKFGFKLARKIFEREV